MPQDPGYFEDDQIGHIADWRLWYRLLAFVTVQWKWLTVAVVLSILVTASSLALPRIVQLAMDDYIIAPDKPADVRAHGLAVLAAFFIVIVVLGFVVNFLQVIVLEWTGQNIMQSIRQKLFTHVIEQNLAFFHARPIGRLVTRLTNDIQNMYEMFTSVIVTVFNDAVRILGILGILFWMNWKLGLMLSLTFPIMMFITWWFGRLSRDAFRRIRKHLATINSFLQETVFGISVIQLFSREDESKRRFEILNGQYYKAAFQQIWIFGVFVPLIEVMASIGLALIIWYGGSEILEEHMTLGILTAFISYLRLFFQPLRELSQKYSIVQSAMASAERIFHLLEIREFLPKVEHPVVPERLDGSIAFENVEFSYELGKPVLENFSFRVNPGETLAIVGATGSGKTTVISLLERFYDPDDGRIAIDGVDLRELDVRWLRERVGLVMQDVFIIPGTVRENILLDRQVSDEDLDRIIRLAQLSSWVEQLTNGLETRIGEGGVDLSAGQRQLLAFARVLARDPGILVLDEATANVDTQTEMLIEQAIEAALAGRTSILIAHRLSTIRRAHRILVMDHGRIVEQGNHEALMGQRGLYYHLQTLQNGSDAASDSPPKPLFREHPEAAL